MKIIVKSIGASSSPISLMQSQRCILGSNKKKKKRGKKYRAVRTLHLLPRVDALRGGLMGGAKGRSLLPKCRNKIRMIIR